MNPQNDQLSVGLISQLIALHQYHRGHGFESYSGITAMIKHVFLSFSTVQKYRYALKSELYLFV